ncbi:hypothetical protein CTAYLR_005242 [Chrysophaeum taylorii]|uniref:C2 domain-containing protein n=1 Tax=Chrysophaeum taylorii TaxID=2483200 RepID=A0AAD7UB19_9STRA|nr:hypothetical protein CTAYLR_005242 [Chrysophaeum taylorii]
MIVSESRRATQLEGTRTVCSQWVDIASNGPSTQSEQQQQRRGVLKRSDTLLWECEMYVRWINSRLRERREAGMVALVEDLATDLRTGVVLYHLLEALSGQSLRTRLNVRGTMKIHHISNLNVYFAALRNAGVKTVNVGPNDIYDGNVTCILGLMWTNICFFALRESKIALPVAGGKRDSPNRSNSAGASRDDVLAQLPIMSGDAVAEPPESDDEDDLVTLKRSLLYWADELTVGAEEVRPLPRDLRSAFRDGRVLAAMLKQLDPRAPDYDPTASPAENMRRCFEHAETVFDVPLLVDASKANPLDDEKALVAYLCEFKHCVAQNSVPRTFMGLPHESVESDFQGSSAVDIDDADDDEIAAPRAEELEYEALQRTCSDYEDDDDDKSLGSMQHEVATLCKSPPPKLRRPGVVLDGDDRVVVDEGDDRGDSRRNSPVVELSRCQIAQASFEPESIKIAVGLHGARGLFGGRRINPYCVIKYGDVEIKTHHVDSTCDPEWNHTQIIEIEHPLRDKTALIVVYLFSANTLFADSLLGKVELLLWNLLEIGEEETNHQFGPCCLMKRSYLAVTPCDTSEQDDLRHTRFSGTRSVQRNVNFFHDNKVLFKNAGFLGAIEVSVFSMGRSLDHHHAS